MTHRHCVISRIDRHNMLGTENEWWEVIYNSGLRALFEKLDTEQQGPFRAQHLQEVASLKQDDGIWMDANVIYTQATKI